MARGRGRVVSMDLKLDVNGDLISTPTVMSFRKLLLEPLFRWRADVYKETGFKPEAAIVLPSELFDRLALELDAKAYVDSFVYASIEVQRERPILPSTAR